MLRLGTETVYGRIVAILYQWDERLYCCLKHGVVSLIPANALEAAEQQQADEEALLAESEEEIW